MNDSVYNSTTVSYENPGGSPNVRPWNLSEMVSPPPIRTKYLHWLLLVGGVLGIVIGVTASFVGIYSHTAELDSKKNQYVHMILYNFSLVFRWNVNNSFDHISRSRSLPQWLDSSGVRFGRHCAGNFPHVFLL